MTGGIIEIDVHGKNTEEAKKAINMQIHAAGKSIYRIRVIHGYNGGTRIRSMLREEYGYGREPAVKRIEMGRQSGNYGAGNQGVLMIGGIRIGTGDKGCG